MKDALKKVVVAASLAFTSASAAALAPTDAEACKITMYAKSAQDPLRNLPPEYQKHSKSWVWISFAYGLGAKGEPGTKLGGRPVGDNFEKAAKACGAFLKNYVKDKNAKSASWEMLCNWDRSRTSNPEYRRIWGDQIKRYCGNKGPLSVR